jgi:hypothetical protein
MSSYNPATDREKIRQAVETIHQTLRDRLGDGVDLQQVTDEFNRTYGLNWTPKQVAPYLDSELESRRAQGVSSTSTAAGVASDNAAQYSAAARQENSPLAHHTASASHADAAAAHRNAAAYHDKAAAYHSDKAAGRHPANMGDE